MRGVCLFFLLRLVFAVHTVNALLPWTDINNCSFETAPVSYVRVTGISCGIIDMMQPKLSGLWLSSVVIHGSLWFDNLDDLRNFTLIIENTTFQSSHVAINFGQTAVIGATINVDEASTFSGCSAMSFGSVVELKLTMRWAAQKQQSSFMSCPYMTMMKGWLTFDSLDNSSLNLGGSGESPLLPVVFVMAPLRNTSIFMANVTDFQTELPSHFPYVIWFSSADNSRIVLHSITVTQYQLFREFISLTGSAVVIESSLLASPTRSNILSVRDTFLNSEVVVMNSSVLLSQGGELLQVSGAAMWRNTIRILDVRLDATPAAVVLIRSSSLSQCMVQIVNLRLTTLTHPVVDLSTTQAMLLHITLACISSASSLGGLLRLGNVSDSTIVVEQLSLSGRGRTEGVIVAQSINRTIISLRQVVLLNMSRVLEVVPGAALTVRVGCSIFDREPMQLASQVGAAITSFDTRCRQPGGAFCSVTLSTSFSDVGSVSYSAMIASDTYSEIMSASMTHSVALSHSIFTRTDDSASLEESLLPRDHRRQHVSGTLTLSKITNRISSSTSVMPSAIQHLQSKPIPQAETHSVSLSPVNQDHYTTYSFSRFPFFTSSQVRGVAVFSGRTGFEINTATRVSRNDGTVVWTTETSFDNVIDLLDSSIVVAVSGIPSFVNVTSVLVGGPYGGRNIPFDLKVGRNASIDNVTIPFNNVQWSFRTDRPYSPQEVVFEVALQCNNVSSTFTLRVRVVPRPLPVATDVTAMIMSSQGASAVIADGTALILGRISSMVSIATCQATMDGTGSGVGIIPVAFASLVSVNTIIGNLLFVSVICTAGLVLAAVTHKYVNHLDDVTIPFSVVATDVFLFPSCVIPPLAATLSTSVTAVVALIRDGVSGGATGAIDITALVVAASLYSASVGVVAVLAYHAHRCLELHEDADAGTSDTANGKMHKFARRALVSTHKWVVVVGVSPRFPCGLPTALVTPMFKEVKAVWYLPVDISVSMVSALLAGLPLNDRAWCKGIASTNIVLATAMLALFVVLRPYSAPVSRWLALLSLLASVSISLLVLVFIVLPRTQTAAVGNAMQYVSLSLSFLAVLRVLLDIGNTIASVRKRIQLIASHPSLPLCSEMHKGNDGQVNNAPLKQSEQSEVREPAVNQSLDLIELDPRDSRASSNEEECGRLFVAQESDASRLPDDPEQTLDILLAYQNTFRKVDSPLWEWSSWREALAVFLRFCFQLFRNGSFFLLLYSSSMAPAAHRSALTVELSGIHTQPRLIAPPPPPPSRPCVIQQTRPPTTSVTRRQDRWPCSLDPLLSRQRGEKIIVAACRKACCFCFKWERKQLTFFCLFFRKMPSSLRRVRHIGNWIDEHLQQASSANCLLQRHDQEPSNIANWLLRQQPQDSVAAAANAPTELVSPNDNTAPPAYQVSTSESLHAAIRNFSGTEIMAGPATGSYSSPMDPYTMVPTYECQVALADIRRLFDAVTDSKSLSTAVPSLLQSCGTTIDIVGERTSSLGADCSYPPSGDLPAPARQGSAASKRILETSCNKAKEQWSTEELMIQLAAAGALSTSALNEFVHFKPKDVLSGATSADVPEIRVKVVEGLTAPPSGPTVRRSEARTIGPKSTTSVVAQSPPRREAYAAPPSVLRLKKTSRHVRFDSPGDASPSSELQHRRPLPLLDRAANGTVHKKQGKMGEVHCPAGGRRHETCEQAPDKDDVCAVPPSLPSTTRQQHAAASATTVATFSAAAVVPDALTIDTRPGALVDMRHLYPLTCSSTLRVDNLFGREGSPSYCSMTRSMSFVTLSKQRERKRCTQDSEDAFDELRGVL